jgi:hypothetical protein
VVPSWTVFFWGLLLASLLTCSLSGIVEPECLGWWNKPNMNVRVGVRGTKTTDQKHSFCTKSGYVRLERIRERQRSELKPPWVQWSQSKSLPPPVCFLLSLFLIPLLAVCSMVFTCVSWFIGLGFGFRFKRLVLVWFQFFFIFVICFQFLGLGGGLSFGSFIICFLVRFRFWFSVP